MKLDKEITLKVSPFGGLMVHSKFFISIFYIEKMNDMINKQYRTAKSIAFRAYKEQDFERYVFFHTRPYRLESLLTVPKKYRTAELVYNVWVDSEDPETNLDVWIRLMKSVAPKKGYYYDNEPLNKKKFRIYQGYSDVTKSGISWSTSKEVALFFANRFNAKGKIRTKIVSIDEIDAYLTSRGEYEIIIFKSLQKTCVIQ